MARRRGNPWSYKLDYDKAIAEDEAFIAFYTKVIEAKLFPEQPGDMLLDVIVCCGGWERLGLSRQDALDLRDEFEYRESDLPGDNPSSDQDCYRNANRVYDEVVAPLGDRYTPVPADEAEAKKLLRKAKASRTRHLRNKEKYGD